MCYPVVTTGEFAHQGSFENLLGKDCADGEKRTLVSLEKQVTADMPAHSSGIPLQTTRCRWKILLLLAQAMREAGRAPMNCIFSRTACMG